MAAPDLKLLDVAFRGSPFVQLLSPTTTLDVAFRASPFNSADTTGGGGGGTNPAVLGAAVVFYHLSRIRAR